MRLRHIGLILTCFLLLPLLVSCEVKIQGEANGRSGTINDDYIEEPLGERSKKYEDALTVSNIILYKLSMPTIDYHTIYNDFLDPRLKAQVDESEFTIMLKELDTRFGRIKHFKPMQWNFIAYDEGGAKVLYSIKIVECEKGTARYYFKFEDDGKYQKLIGLKAKESAGVTPPGQL